MLLDTNQWATISPDGLYRYDLGRRWKAGGCSLLWVMLNPSTADATKDDNTVVAITKYSQAWGYHALAVVNLFAYRSAYPTDLKTADDPIGPLNDEYIEGHAKLTDGIVCAWGAFGTHLGRHKMVYDMLRVATPSTAIWCLGLTKDGHPWHPLRKRADLQPQDYVPT